MEAPPNYVFRDRPNAERLHDVMLTARWKLSIEEIIAKRYVAVALEDCRTSGDIYESRDDAVRLWRRGDANQVMYLQVPATPWNLKTCDSLLWYCRGVYKNGYRPAGQHAGTGLILPNSEQRYQ